MRWVRPDLTTESHSVAFLARDSCSTFRPGIMSLTAASVAALIFTPVTISASVTDVQVAILLVGLVLSIVANAVLLRLSLRPLRRLMEMMLVIDVVEPGVRTEPHGPVEVASVIIRFNLMLDRLEHERRHSMRRVLVAQEAERRRLADGCRRVALLATPEAADEPKAAEAEGVLDRLKRGERSQ